MLCVTICDQSAIPAAKHSWIAYVVCKKGEHRCDIPADVGFYLKTTESASRALGQRNSGTVYLDEGDGTIILLSGT